MIHESSTFTAFRLRVELRTLHPKGYLFEDLTPRGFGGEGFSTVCPPAIGDIMYLAEPGGPGVVKVVDRVWHYPSFGSMNWNHGGINEDPQCTIYVEAAQGMYVDEWPTKKCEDCAGDGGYDIHEAGCPACKGNGWVRT